ncbi:MAG TPA: hypothetical protein PLE36_12820 [Deltaproteobacteria bacterium]|jgi:hypothetical protein|nr:hypothetical protein [Deltaproteobacteria bacterium]
MTLKVVHQGRGGYIESQGLRFDIELQASGPVFAIWFPRRKLDKTIAKAKVEIEQLIEKEPNNWELVEYDTPHKLYDGMTVNERLSFTGLDSLFDKAIESGDRKLSREILSEVEVPDSAIEEILKKGLTR